MNGEDEQHTRICILERLFEDFNLALNKHMDTEEKTFKEMHRAVMSSSSEILHKINTNHAENKSDHDRIIENLQKTLDKNYVSKPVLESKLTGVKLSILTEIKLAKKSAYAEIFRIILGFSFALSLSAWVYIHTYI